MFLYFFSITIIVSSIQSSINASEHEIENYTVGGQLNDLTQEDQALIDGKSSSIISNNETCHPIAILSSSQE